MGPRVSFYLEERVPQNELQSYLKQVSLGFVNFEMNSGKPLPLQALLSSIAEYEVVFNCLPQRHEGPPNYSGRGLPWSGGRDRVGEILMPSSTKAALL